MGVLFLLSGPGACIGHVTKSLRQNSAHPALTPIGLQEPVIFIPADYRPYSPGRPLAGPGHAPATTCLGEAVQVCRPPLELRTF
ncbi:hypothetical protein SZ55_5379 [Pseudomonas sp. FeS53a]|nr:hypothetical protein SZ55_5379 [Pseudomonas sp. FeS53a]